MTQILFNGVGAGLAYALIALAVTLVFGLARIVHFAVADFAMLAAISTVAAVQKWHNWPAAVLIGVAVALGITLITERLVFRFTINRPMTGFLVSVAMIFILRAFAARAFGSDSRTVPGPFTHVWDVGGVLMRSQVIVNSAIALVIIAGMFAILHRTRLGLALRALADNRHGALLMGAPVSRLITVSFLLSGIAIAGVSYIMATTGAVSATTGDGYVLRGFAAALIGGLGNIKGALVAGVLVGVAENLAIGYGNPGWSEIYLFGIVIAILLVRPTGLWRGGQGAEIHA